ncbi:Uncharacterised protein [Mycobacteroides abscessus subsp. abscessus]|nr:Uncharacterised protein [Mycobacteroides abscessus subsp. abscessus]
MRGGPSGPDSDPSKGPRPRSPTTPARFFIS